MWKKIKKVFKKKRKKDQVVSFDGGVIGIKDVMPYKIEADVDLMTGNELPSNMKIHCIYKGRVAGGKFLWEVNKIEIEAFDIIDAQRIYIKLYMED